MGNQVGEQELTLQLVTSALWGLTGSTSFLQRGFDKYTVRGAEEELCLGPPMQLIFVVHGIGEHMWSRDDLTYVPSLIESVDEMRILIHLRQCEQWRQQQERAG